MGTKISPCNPTHGDGHSLFYEGNHRDYHPFYFPVNLHPLCCAVTYHHLLGMWYFSLNNSIRAGVSTKRSNLPIVSLWNVEWLAEEVSRGYSGGSECETYVRLSTDWSSCLWKIAKLSFL